MRTLLVIGVLGVLLGVPAARAADHLLLSEVAVFPTDAECIAIVNPTGTVIDLSDYYLSDYVLSIDPLANYWHLVDGGLIPDPSFPVDFLVRFPDGAVIEPQETILIALHDDGAFRDTWSDLGFVVVPDYELIDDGEADGVPGLVDPGPSLIGLPFVQTMAGLSNNREVVVLFQWDGVGDLVRDVDIVQWGNAGPDFPTVSPDKSGVSVDSAYDGDDTPSSYLDDTTAADQDLASTLSPAHDPGRTLRRVDLEEGTESSSGGNGLTGHDETSENLSATWLANALPSFGKPTLVERTSWGRVKARYRREGR